MRLSVQAIFLRVFVFALFLSILIIVASFANLAFAQENYQEEDYQIPSYKTPNVNPDVPLNQHTYMQTMVLELGSTIICQLAGIDIINPMQGCLGIDPTTKKIGFVKPQMLPDGTPAPGGALGAMGNLISGLYIPPASTHAYTDYLASNFYLIQKTYAQRVTPAKSGFEGLKPLVSIWKTIRNVSYSLLVIVFMFVGLGIMLRIKIDPRTVMTLQNQIPKIVIAIILITFSFAIVGVLIDLMWVGTYYGINLLSESVIDRTSPGTEAQTKPIADRIRTDATRNVINNPIAFTANVFSGENEFLGLAKIAGDVGMNIGRVISGVMTVSLWNAGTVIQNCSFSDYLSKFGDCIQGQFFSLLTWFIGIIGVLIVLITLFIVLLKLWIALLKAYIWVLFDVITAPFWILAGLNPFGTSLGFKHWIQHVIAHLSVFPAAAFMIIIAKIFLVTFSPSLTLAGRGTTDAIVLEPGREFFIAPLIGNGAIFGFLGELIAFGVLLMTPDLLNILRDTLKQPGTKYAANIRGRFFAGSPTNLAGPLGTFGYQWHYLKEAPVAKSIFSRFGGGDQAERAAQQRPGAGA